MTDAEPDHPVKLRVAGLMAVLGAAGLVAIGVRGYRVSGGDVVPLLLPLLLALWLLGWAFLKSVEDLTYRLFMRHLVPTEDWDELEAGILLAICLVLSLAWSFASVGLVEARLRESVEKRYGISIQTPRLRIGDRTTRVVTLDRIEDWGAFARAGARPGDIVVAPTPAAALLRKLHRTQPNTTLPIDVVPGGEGPALASRPRRTLDVLIP